MPRYSKTLHKLAIADPRIDEYEYDPDNDMGCHWLHLKWPYVIDDGSGSIHQHTVVDCLAELRFIIHPSQPTKETDHAL